MFYQSLLTLAFCMKFLIVSGALLPMNCTVTEWSAWSEPYGFGQIARERHVRMHALNNGTECPELEDRLFTVARPTVYETAKAVAQKFIIKTRQENGVTIGQVRDLLVIVDSSGSIGGANFNKATNQLARLLGLLCPSPDPFDHIQQAALVEFSSTVREIFDFNDKGNTQQVQDGVRSMAYMAGSTCSATAFDFAKTNMFTTAKGMRTRSGVKQEVLILSDGGSNCGGDAVAAARELQSKAEVFALVIGAPSIAEKQELTNYVSMPSRDHLFSVLNYDELETLVNDIESQVNLPCVPFEKR